MDSGYLSTSSPSSRKPTWHLFRGIVSLCGLHEVQELPTGELELVPLRIATRRYCQICQRILVVERHNGWPVEPALSKADKAFIIANYATHSAAEITRMLGRSIIERVKEFAGRHCPTKETNTGRFQKGQQPRNAKPDQEQFMRKDKRGIYYWHVRGGKFGYQYKHVAVWEAANGPVPAGMVVTFSDGNTLNCVLGNLELLSKADNLARNSGRAELTDDYVAELLSRTGRGTRDEALREAVRQVPELLEVKRNQLRLKQRIKQS